MKRLLKEQAGSTLVMVMMVIILMTLIASGLFWMFTRTLPLRIDRVQALEHRLIMENLTNDIIVAFFANPEAVEDYTPVPDHDDFEYQIVADGAHWLVQMRGVEVLTNHVWTVRMQVLSDPDRYVILEQGMVMGNGD